MRDTSDPTVHPDLNRAIANAVVRCYRRVAGRGPTEARAFFHGDVVVVVLGGVLTVGERTLAAHGRQDAVRHLRAAMRETIGAELAGSIRALTGCQVQIAVSDIDVDGDAAAELFVLERPVPEDRA